MQVPDRYSECTRKLCNLWQSPEERKEKYLYCRTLGVSSFMAYRMRDWQWETIDRYFSYKQIYEDFVQERQAQGVAFSAPAPSHAPSA